MIRVVSKDKDLEQLLSDRVSMFDIHTDATVDVATLKASKGLTPAQTVEALALMGDSVDNVPGVPGIGPKTRRQAHPGIRLDRQPARQSRQGQGQDRENLEAAKDILSLSRKLVQLNATWKFPSAWTRRR